MDEVKVPKWLWGIVVASILGWMGWVSVQIQSQSLSMMEMKTILTNIVTNDYRNYTNITELQKTVVELTIKVKYLEQEQEKIKRSP